MKRSELIKLGDGYSLIFVNHGGNILRMESNTSKLALKKTAKELDLTQTHIRSAIDAWQWD